jgi:hypothetical protein
MEFKCPKCGSVIYSRRNVLCGVCGERLPDELLFTAEQRAVMDRELADSKRKAREARQAQSGLGRTTASSAEFWYGSDFGGLP